MSSKIVEVVYRPERNGLGVKSLIDLPLTTKLGHKIQNPALHLFRVTGFWRS